MINLNIHHIGYLVKKILPAVNDFKQLGYTIKQDISYDSSRRIDICFMAKDGYTIELVSPTDPDSIVAGLLKKYKNTPYHICYETSNLTESFRQLTAEGYTAIDTAAPAPALEGRKVVFLMNPHIGMIELLES